MSRLLGLEDDRDGQVWPADVLLCRAQDVHTGVGPGGAGKVALDVGIICPQAACHLGNTVEEPLGAAEEHVKTKCAPRAGRHGKAMSGNRDCFSTYDF